jgi:hypothetical protein
LETLLDGLEMKSAVRIFELQPGWVGLVFWQEIGAEQLHNMLENCFDEAEGSFCV